MADSIRECGFLPHQNIPRYQFILFKSRSQKIFSDPVPVHLLLRIDLHAIGDKIQIAEGHSRLERVYADAPVSAQHIVHVDLPDPLLRFLLESFSIRREIRVLVPEDLI